MATTLVLVAAVAALLVRPAPVRTLLGGAAPSPAPTFSAPAPQPVLAVAGDAPLPTTEGLTTAIEGLVTDGRVGDLSVSIVDLETGQQLYHRDSQARMVPASVTKLVTGAAALAAWGPNHRLATRAVAGSEPGEVVLVGGGDPTLAVDGNDTYRGAARLDQLAAQVKRQLGETELTRIVVDGSIFTGPTLGPGWDSDIASYGYGGHITGLMVNGGRTNPEKSTPRSGQPHLAAGKAFAKLLGVPENAVTTGAAPRDARQLGLVESPPMIRLVEIMIGDSDNVVAEALGRQVALAEGLQPSFQGAAQATATVLGELGVTTDQLDLADNSGLSRQNGLTASLLTSLLVLAASDDHPKLSGLLTGLAVAGHSGTLHDRFAGPAATGAGVVRAKTGTLSGVSSLAGVLVDADGRPLGFALVANDVPGGSWAAEAVLDRIGAALAGCGCR